MQITGLQKDDVKSLEETIARLQTVNPNITFKLTEDKPKPKDVAEELRLLNEKVDSLINNFKLTFGGHVLIKGRWVKPAIMKEVWKG